MKRVSTLLAGALAAGLFATSASAQVAGVPVTYAPAGTGVTIHGEYGRCLDTGCTSNIGGGVTVGMPSLQFSGLLSYLDLGGANQIAFGGNVGYKLPLPPTTPVGLAIMAGVGVVSSGGVTNIAVPVGPALTFDVPSAAVDVTPWVSAQFRYFRQGAVGAFPSASTSDFGASGGVMIGLPVGIGFRLGLDYDNAASLLTIGVGAQYNISVPSLGGM